MGFRDCEFRDSGIEELRNSGIGGLWKVNKQTIDFSAYFLHIIIHQEG